MIHVTCLTRGLHIALTAQPGGSHARIEISEGGTQCSHVDHPDNDLTTKPWRHKGRDRDEDHCVARRPIRGVKTREPCRQELCAPHPKQQSARGHEEAIDPCTAPAIWDFTPSLTWLWNPLKNYTFLKQDTDGACVFTIILFSTSAVSSKDPESAKKTLAREKFQLER